MSLENTKLTLSLYLAFKMMQKVFQGLAQDYGLAGAQWGALKFLWKTDGLTVSNLSEKLFLKNSTMTTLIDRMVRDGFVERKRDTEDRRVVKIYLTEKGAAFKDRVIDFESHFTDEIRGWLSEEEIDTLKHLLEKMSRGISRARQ